VGLLLKRSAVRELRKGRRESAYLPIDFRPLGHSLPEGSFANHATAWLELFDGFGETWPTTVRLLSLFVEGVLRRVPVRNFQVDHVDRSNAAG